MTRSRQIFIILTLFVIIMVCWSVSMMSSSNKFVRKMEEYQRPTREMLVSLGDPGCKPITKISGVPWWPAGVERPTCSKGHLMSFMGQFLLSDVPNFESHTDSLVSFHYCQECSYDGTMSFGWDDTENKSGYDISILTSVSSKKSDNLGTVAEVVIKPYSVTLQKVMEIPGISDLLDICPEDLPEEYPQGEDDLDEKVFPGLIHVSKRKLGGWPSWVQDAYPPAIADNEQLHFLGQLDWWLCDRATWASGGYAYLFIISSKDGEILRIELSLQTT
jgi:uncharacterized protein YwqG